MRLGSPVSARGRLCLLAIALAASASVHFSLGQAVPATSAKKQFGELVRLVERLGQINFETRYSPQEFRFDILWQYEKK